MIKVCVFFATCTGLLFALCVDSESKTNIIRHVINRLPLDSDSNYATIVTADVKKLSTISLRMMHDIFEKFPSAAVTKDVMTTKEKKKFAPARKMMLNLSERMALKILIMDLTLRNKINLRSEFVLYFSLLKNYMIKISRPRCLIFLIIDKHYRGIKNILKKMWSIKYLYVTVIEITISRRLVKRKTLQNHQDSICKFRTIVYNPYKNQLRIERRIKNDSLFSDQLNDLNGYPLIMETLKKNFTLYSNIDKSDSAIRYIDKGITANLIKYIMDTTNCSAIVQSSSTKNENTLERFSKDTLDIRVTTINTPKSFSTSYTITNYFKFNYFYEVFCIKQNGYYKKVKMWNLILSCLVFVFLIILFSKTVKLLKLSSELSNWYVIMMVLLGSGIEKPLKKFDRVIYLFLVYLSVSFTSDLVDNIFSTSFSIKEFYDFKSINDIIETPFSLQTGSELMEELNYQNKQSRQLSILKNKINKTHPATNINCFYLMYLSNMNLCMDVHHIAEIHQTFYNHYVKDGSILTLVDEPIDLNSYFHAVALSIVSPYVNKISDLLCKMTESGIMKFLSHSRVFWFYFYRNQVKTIKTPVFKFKEIKLLLALPNNKKMLQKIPNLSAISDDFVTRLLYFLVICLTISTIVFIIEINIRPISYY